jgi:hypothetical protein
MVASVGGKLSLAERNESVSSQQFWTFVCIYGLINTICKLFRLLRQLFLCTLEWIPVKKSCNYAGQAANKKDLDFQYAVDYLRRFFGAATLKKPYNPQ